MGKGAYRYIAGFAFYILTIHHTFSQGLWSQKGNFLANGTSYPICFSIGDKGYVGGGISKSGKETSLWEYDPLTDVWIQKANMGGGTHYDGTCFTAGGNAYVVAGDFDSTCWEYSPTQNKWTQKASFPGGKRSSTVSFSINGKGYVGFGYITGPGNKVQDGLWEYDPALDRWTKKGAFPGGKLFGAVGFSIMNKGYMGIAKDSLYKKRNDFWEYEPVTDKWTRKSNFPGATVESEGRFSIGEKGYVCSGYDSTGKLISEAWEYNVVSDTWSKIANYEGAKRGGGISFSIGRKGYFGAGESASPGMVYYTDFWEFDPYAVLSWKGKADFGGASRYEAICFTIKDKGYIGGGSSNISLYDFWEFDATNNVWTQKANLKTSHEQLGFSIGNKGYFLAFVTGGNDTLWEYDPALNVWKARANFPGGDRDRGVAFSCNGKGYVGSGIYNNSVYLSDFWEYDPARNTWTRKADYAGGMCYGGTGFSIGNKGYMGLGAKSSASFQKSFWEYDPASDQWTAKADFPSNARYGATGFSIGEKGYIGLGVVYDGTAMKDFWEYNPVYDTWKRKENFGGGGRSWAAGFSIGDKGYVGTGYNFLENQNDGKKDFWEFDPVDLKIMTMEADSFCANEKISMTYKIRHGDYPIQFELSDPDGDFQNIIPLDNVTGPSGIYPIQLKIPAVVFEGDGYRIRITGGGDTSNLSPRFRIRKTKTSAISGMDTVAVNAMHQYRVVATAGSTYQWFVESGRIQADSLPDDSVAPVQWKAHRGMGLISVVESAMNGCVGDTIKKKVVIRNAIDSLIFTKDSIILEVSADSAQLGIVSNVDWSIQDTNQWFKISPVAGSDASVITLKTGENPFFTERMARVTAMSGSLRATFIVVQKAKAYVGLQDPVSGKQLILSPNPVNSFIEIRGLGERAVIHDIFGKEVLVVEGDGFYDVSVLKQGIYFLQAHQQVHKFVKY
jgi:N-acetylneuraminic acid mutarotase